jgi:hypothetical protein
MSDVLKAQCGLITTLLYGRQKKVCETAAEYAQAIMDHDIAMAVTVPVKSRIWVFVHQLMRTAAIKSRTSNDAIKVKDDDTP